MSTRAGFLWGLALMGLGVSILPTRAQTPGDEPRTQQLDEARLNVELLQLELDTEKTQLRQLLQSLKYSEFSSAGMGGMGGTAPDPEERKKLLAKMRERYAELRAAALETSKKLGEERRRLAGLEGRPEDTGGDRGRSEGRDRAASGRRGRGGFVKAGKELINRKRIEHATQTGNGLIRVEMVGGKTIVLGNEAAKEFLEAMAAEGR